MAHRPGPKNSLIVNASRTEEDFAWFKHLDAGVR